MDAAGGKCGDMNRYYQVFAESYNWPGYGPGPGAAWRNPLASYHVTPSDLWPDLAMREVVRNPRIPDTALLSRGNHPSLSRSAVLRSAFCVLRSAFCGKLALTATHVKGGEKVYHCGGRCRSGTVGVWRWASVLLRRPQERYGTGMVRSSLLGACLGASCLPC